MYLSRSSASYRGICVFLLGVLSGVPAGLSQDANFPAPTLRVSTHLVLLDVVVTDKTGKPITGLSSDDFTVRESGKPQKVSFFTAPAQTVASPAPALPPGVYSNAPAYRTAGGPPTVIVLDAANTQYRDQTFARLQMLKFVTNQYKPGQRIAIFTLTNNLSLVQDFTDNPDVLRATFEK
jgi:VWFA-related protein